MVEAGLGVSILPELVVAAGLAHGVLVDVLPGETFRFPILQVTRRDHELTRGATALLAQVVSRLAVPSADAVDRRKPRSGARRVRRKRR
jgi:DNA-binding transcriptional LysR family regulator